MTATTDYLPTREADLAAWSTNFDARINDGEAAYGLTVAQATAYTALHDAFVSAWTTANENLTRTPSAVQTKNTAKAALISGPGGIRELVAIVQSFPGTTDTMRVDLEITVRDAEPTPIPPPAAAPGLDIVLAVGRTVKVRLHDAESPATRGKPAGVKGASIYSFVGESPPNEIDQWKYEGSTTKTVLDVEFAPTVANGATVWFTAYWTNPKLQSGPVSQPVSTNIPGGLSAAA